MLGLLGLILAPRYGLPTRKQPWQGVKGMRANTNSWLSKHHKSALQPSVVHAARPGHGAVEVVPQLRSGAVHARHVQPIAARRALHERRLPNTRALAPFLRALRI